MIKFNLFNLYNLNYIKLIIISFPIQFSSQNLVINPSFEITRKCADSVSHFSNNVLKWSSPSIGTPDLFNSCSKSQVKTPDNFNGYQVAKFGDNYAGCYLYALNNYREYIQGRFSSPLQKGEKYDVSFYISLAEKSNYSLKKINFILTQNMVLTSYSTEITPNKIQKLLTDSFSINNIENKNSFNNKNNWILISKEITAKGGEKYITIGNFSNNSSTKTKKILKNKKNKMAYYYIDMVSVELVNKPLIQQYVIKIPKRKEIKLNKNYLFKNVIFDFNSIELSKPAKAEIDNIYEYLNSNLNTRIIITGHSDNLGSNKYNRLLTEKRAKSVMEYLIKRGINKNRIQSFGYGNSQPLSTNKTNEGRNKNRRVEFKITK